MPKIVEIKADENDQVWCNIGRIVKEGAVMVLTEEELNNIRQKERSRMIRLMEIAATYPDKVEALEWNK